MNVSGQLESAQLEQVTALPAAPQPTGRVVTLVPTPPATGQAIPYIWDSAAWQRLPFYVAPSTAPTILAQNSSTDVTVDWSQNLTQQVNLTGNCFIRFINPQEGQEHKLMVTQAPPILAMNGSNISYNFKLVMPDQETRRFDVQDTYSPNIGETVVMKWRYHAGIRQGYQAATMPMTQNPYPPQAPGTAVPTLAYNAAFKVLSVGQNAAPYQGIYQVQEVTPTEKNSLAAYKNFVPGSIGSTFAGQKFSARGQILFTAIAGSPFIGAQALYLDKAAIFSSQPNPATLPAGAGASLDVHPNDFVAIGHATSPFMSLYPYNHGGATSLTGWGPRLTNPATLPTAQVNAIQFSPLGDFLAISMNTTPFIMTYPFTDPGPTGVATIGAVCPAPAVLPAAGVSVNVNSSLAWRPQGDYIAMAIGVTPFLYVVPFNRATGTYGIPLAIPTLSGVMNTVAWTPDGTYLLVGGNITPYFYCFDFSGVPSGGTIPATAITNYFNPGNIVNTIQVHPSGTYCWLGMNAGTSGLVQVALPTRARNYLRLME